MEEKKGDILNQLAMIADLLEKVNAETISTSIIIELPVLEFQNIFDIIEKRYDKKIIKPDNTFNVSIGKTNIIFNKSSV